ncbi:protein phosphatase 2C domain-containing protein [Actinophytocola sp.]|uniref:protein phosphatase 2C domain-containing protein n=1 Tax=Actinophytocola sp. TaxID=1872138 RepID=UPI003D6A1763
MRIDLVSVAGEAGRANEDFAATAAGGPPHAGGAAVVLDGVTPPADGRTGCSHGVPWFAARLGGALLESAVSRSDSLADCLAEAVARTAAAHGPGCDLSHAHTPQATVAAARWDDERVEYLVLSDAVLLLENTAGEVEPVLDDRLTEVRHRPEVAALRERVLDLPEGSAERAEARRVLVRTVDALRNTDGGFFTAAGDATVAARAVTGTRPRGQVRALTTLTDGAARWSEVFRLGDWAELFATLRESGAASLVTRVRAAEAADPGGAAYPRGKATDDASAVFVELT